MGMSTDTVAKERFTPTIVLTSAGHITIQAEDGTLSCNCLGFMYKGRCKHIDSLVGEQTTAQLKI